MKEENVEEKNTEKKSRKGNDFITRESFGAVGAIFTLFALFIVITGKAIFGDIGYAIRTFLLGSFGYSIYFILPLLFLISVSAFIGKRFFKGHTVTAIYVVLLILQIFLLIHTASTMSSVPMNGYLKECYKLAEDGVASSTASGCVGGCFAYLLLKLSGKTGAIIIESLVLLTLVILSLRKVISKLVHIELPKKEHVKKSEKTKKEEEVLEAQEIDNSFVKPENTFVNNGYYANEQQKEQYPEQRYTAPQQQYQNSEPMPEFVPVTPEMRQRPGVKLSSNSASQPVAENNKGQASTSFSPFGYNQGGQTSYGDPEKLGRDFLFGGNLADNYKKNLIFDSNSKVNNRPAYDPDKQSNGGYANNSYTQDYNNYMNNAPEKVVSDTGSVYGQNNAYDNFATQKPETNYNSTFNQPTFNQPTYTPPTEYKKEESVIPERTDTFAREERNDIYAENKSSDPYSLQTPTENNVPERETFTRNETPSVDQSRGSSFLNLFSASNLDKRGNSDFGNQRDNIIPNREETRGRDIDIFDDNTEEITSSRDREIDLGGRNDRSLEPEIRNDRDIDLGGRNDRSIEPEIRSDRDIDLGGRNDRSIEPEIRNGRDIDLGDRNDRNIEPERTERRMPEPEVKREAEPEPEKTFAPPEPVKKIIRPYQPAPITLFDCRETQPDENEAEVAEKKEIILDTLNEFKVTDSTIASVTHGPTVTRYNVAIPRSISPKKVVALDQEIAISLRAGKGVNIYPNFEDGAVSIEVPNSKRQFVTLGCMIADDKFVNAKPNSLTFALGKDVGNKKVYGDIRKMTHILVAGTSGSGKSVFLHSLIVSLIYKYSPADLRLILVDPKRTEFVIYNSIPHLVINDIISDTSKVIQSLNWAIGEMNRRYTLFEQKSRAGTYVVSIDEYNANLAEGETKLPKIVIIIDELADLMLAAKKEIEDRIQNLTQKSRAAGIHMILTTQRPSADVITGVIKSNLKTRIALSVATDVDSRVILDASGADKLLGKGDMLFSTEGDGLVRVQSPSCPPEEIQSFVNYIKSHNDTDFDDTVSNYINNTKQDDGGAEGGGSSEEVEQVYIEALRYAILSGSASISMIQRKCGVGYNKAGRIIEWMEEMGYISPFDGAKARKVLISKEEFEEKYGQN